MRWFPTRSERDTHRVRFAAVIFDLDGVLVDSERIWDQARRQVTRENGGRWQADATRAMMGMSSREWSTYMREQLGVAMPPPQISETVASQVEQLYREHLPLFPGAREAVVGLARVFPLGLASSANRPIIELVLDESGLRSCFAATVSSEEVTRGKPAPDVYLEAARRLGVSASPCVAVEDSSNGLRSGAAAGMTVIAIPNHDFPPADGALALAADVLDSLAQLTPARLEGLAEARS
jgi:HAD superfamily hydrolase (TIGR01509 family)